MKIDDNLLAYLNGNKFSNGLLVDFGEFEDIGRDRTDALAKLCEGKKVVHFGCADHIPLIKKKIEENNYLHEKLEKSAEQVVGVDNDSAAIEFMTELGYPNVFVYDLFEDSLPEALHGKKYDFLIVGEVLEHVDNPVAFIQKLQREFAPVCESIIITVPNIAVTARSKVIKRNKELINTDHRFWFTPYTLAKVVISAGLTVEKILGTDIKAANYFEKKLLKLGIKPPKMINCYTLVAIANLR